MFKEEGELCIIGASQNGDSVRPLAMMGWEPRQVRKEATVPSDSCAEDRRIGSPPFILHSHSATSQLICLFAFLIVIVQLSFFYCDSRQVKIVSILKLKYLYS